MENYSLVSLEAANVAKRYQTNCIHLVMRNTISFPSETSPWW